MSFFIRDRRPPVAMLLAIAVFAICGTGTAQNSHAPLADPGKQSKVGIVPFADATGAGKPPASPDIAQTLRAAIDQTKPAVSPACKLFSGAEIAKYIGEPVAAPQDVPLGCQWSASDGSGDVLVAIIPAKNHEPPKRSKGYKAVSEPGTSGFVAPYMDGWLAGAIFGKEALRVSAAGAGATEASTLALLKVAASRHTAAAR